MILGSSIIRARDGPHQGLNPKTGLYQTVGWGPKINSSYLGKAYSETWFSNACSLSNLVNRDKSTLPAVAPRQGPSSLQARSTDPFLACLMAAAWAGLEALVESSADLTSHPCTAKQHLFPAAKNFSNGQAEIKLWPQSPLDPNISA